MKIVTIWALLRVYLVGGMISDEIPARYDEGPIETDRDLIPWSVDDIT